MNFPIIEAERIKRRLDKDEFSEMLGVTRRTVQNWQNGYTEIPLSKLVKLSSVWGTSIDYLLGLTDQPDNHQNVS